MTGTITLTTQTTPTPRVGVQLGSWVSPANGSLQVYRVHPDTSEYPVRGSAAGGAWTTSGGAAFAWDYEMPYGVSVTYYALDGATKVTASTTVSVTQAWLRAPGLPGYDIAVTPRGRPQANRGRPAAMLQPIGRATPIVLVDSRSAGQFSIVLRTKTDAAADALDDLLDNATVCLLLVPGVRQRMAWQYVTVTGDTESPVVQYKPASTDAADSAGHWVDWPLTCTVVDRPAGGVYGDPTASYQLLKDSFATYTAVKAYYATYLNVLKGYP